MKLSLALEPAADVQRKFPGEIAGASLKHSILQNIASLRNVNSPAKSPGPH